MNDDDGDDFWDSPIRGMVYAMAFSIPIWGLLGLLLWWILRR